MPKMTQKQRFERAWRAYSKAGPNTRGDVLFNAGILGSGTRGKSVRKHLESNATARARFVRHAEQRIGSKGRYQKRPGGEVLTSKGRR